ncbi:type I-C CRISPR-associated protein Cas7/Csd2 [Holophaga foetida]|uniref:type I-C CRISPR-associated protein Cas7/Csd2 n=1 Tax=Holophaga foetida TaxID=35839 RepID=UPI0002474609|nr:type I-C CRISPR-associated protein Cas7/Csd2 [Holophaga foetida]
MTLTKRYDFVLFFDVQDGNPNGDPDAGNLPRIDAETGRGLVTDVCLKRKVRNFVQLTRGSQAPFDIFVKEKAVLNQNISAAYTALGIDLEKDPADPKDGKKRNTKGAAQGSEVDKGRKALCDRFFDVRTFGAVMSTGANAGQVRGPIQLTFARSVEPIVALEHSITRMAVATEAEAEKQGGDNRTMGRKYTVPYGLYRAHGFVSAHLAAQTGFTQADLDLFWESLENLFEHDRSAARGLMGTRRLVVFEHGSVLGSAPASDLFERVTWERVTEGPAREFSDYRILLDGQPLSQRKTVVSIQ